jgi:hypothetical protein
VGVLSDYLKTRFLSALRTPEAVSELDETLDSLGGSGANQTLSNLTSPTAVNQDFLFDKNDPTIKSKNNTSTQGLSLKSGDASAGNSGEVSLQAGTSTGGTRGDARVTGNNARLLADTNAIIEGPLEVDLITDGKVAIVAYSNVTPTLNIYEQNGTYSVALTVDNSLASDITLTLPAALPSTNNKPLVSSTAGGLTFANLFLQLPTGASDPVGVAAGSVYYNTVSNKVKLYNGSTWETITSA